MAQNKNGPVVGMVIFSLLAVVLGIVAYMTGIENQQKQVALAAATSEQQSSKSVIQDLTTQIESLTTKIGSAANTPVGHNDAADGTVMKSVSDLLTKVGGDGTTAPRNLGASLSQTFSESNRNIFTAEDRKKQADLAALRHQQSIQAKDAEIAQFKAARDKTETDLVKKEQEHSEQIAKLEDQNKALRAEITQKEAEFAATQSQLELTKADLDAAILEQSGFLQELRRQLRKKEDASFSRPDGVVSTVNQEAKLCYLNIGEDAGLQTGTTFSVYTQGNSGVGRADTSDIKGKIEIVAVLGPRRAEARIVDQRDTDPVAPGDPFYSPLFQAGQSLEILVAGQVREMGLNREEFHRLVRSNGAKIAVEISDQGEFVNGRSEQISDDQARALVTARTRFLVIGDTGDPSGSSDDTALETQYKAIRDKTEVLKKEAENLGIYSIELSAFLEHLGYNQNQIAWTPDNGKPFPGALTAGAASSSTRSTFANRVSSASISSKFSERKTSAKESTVITSGAYQK
ncbi:MAG: hypothetical protein R3C49_04215 [Planctomycetaceae bacterium]